MYESVDHLSELRRKIAGIERQRVAEHPALASLGHASIDTQLGGGLALGRLHEIFAADQGDAGSAAGFAAMVALRMARSDAAVVWLRQQDIEARGGRLHAPGLIEIGLDPRRILLGVMPDVLGLLRAAAEVVRCPEVGVAVIELWRMPRVLDLTVSRRLAVACEVSGVTALMLRVEAEPAPSAAQTRWQVRSAASMPLEANAPGHPALEISLLRQRGRPAGARWQVEWDRDRLCFREPGFHAPALSGAVVPLPLRRSAEGQALRRTG